MRYIIALGAMIVTLAFWITLVQRFLAALDENIHNAMLQIGVQLFLQWEVLTNLFDLTSVYAAHECRTIAEIIKARGYITKDSSPEDVIRQGNIIVEAIEKIMAVAESYPVLKTDKAYIKAMDAVNQYENMLNTSRLIFNNSVTRLNRAIRLFPTSMIAGILGFSKHTYIKSVRG